MKIRQGFVSNSSTTSFCIYGSWVDVPRVVEDPNDEDSDYLEDYEVLDDICSKHGLSYSSIDSNYAVGLGPDDIKDNETGAQFKKRVQDAISAAFGPHSCSWIQEAGYDG